ncbi:MAG: DM13 domain-containing protein [Actinomycetota bacterium]
MDGAASSGADTGSTDTATSDDTGPTDATSDLAAEAAVPAEAADTATTGTGTTDTGAGDGDAVGNDAVETSGDASAEPATEQAAAGEVVTELSGQFTGTSRYDVSGDALVLGNGTGQRFLRFENFESNNGPDLNVYLFNPDDPNDFIDLGDLKGNIGDQNYEIPVDVDLDRYSQVSIWCVRFSTGFGFADLV